jgi:hypothetical protein
VYVSGYEFNGTLYQAKYWKNGVATTLGSGNNNAYAASIFVSGSDVYVAGKNLDNGEIKLVNGQCLCSV